MIEASGIHHSYALGHEQLAILSDINLKVEAGEMVAIQGPSGSGKSTLLYLLGCLQKVQKGCLKIDGIDVSHLSEEALSLFRNRKLGFIFQQFHLLPKANVLENILLPARYPAEIASPGPAEVEKARSLAALFGLGDRLGHAPNQLSGGQQQRVAIARALMNDPPVLLADEPTGNLDSRSSAQILELLRDLNRQGRTVVIITHDPEVARKCDRIIHIRDGHISSEERLAASRGEKPANAGGKAPLPRLRALSPRQALHLAARQLPLAWDNLNRNRVRSFLTMFGITIGIAAVLSMVTLGQFTKWKILDSYAELGVNTMAFYGYRNWELKAKDKTPTAFDSFDWDHDIVPLKRVFPQIVKVSPLNYAWGAKAQFGGMTLDTDIRLMGVNADGLPVMNRPFMLGRNFDPYQVETSSGVCVVGYEVAERLLKNTFPIGQVLYLNVDGMGAACRVIGVLKNFVSNKEWMKPNLQIYVPYTFLQSVVKSPWEQRIHNVYIQVKPGTDVERTGKGIRAFFEQKYGKAGRFRVDSDSVLVAQMKKFLTLFTVLLTLIALVSLAVGGIGITNMMLVSVSERYREIGLRKALGATPASVRVQFLTEAVVICTIGGLLGIFFGLASYHLAIWGATKLIPKLHFAWTFDWMAMLLSVTSILMVGVLSGLFPALKAEKLQVIDAIRAD
jgi:macrolide transport system ATP-binding/permease protein